MEKDKFVENPWAEFEALHGENSQEKQAGENFALRCSELQLRSLEKNLANFLRKTKGQRKEAIREYDGFFEDLGECVYEDGMEVLSNVMLDRRTAPEINGYVRQIRRVYGLLGQVLLKGDQVNKVGN